MIKELKTADISADTFVEESKRNKSIATGATLAGTVLASIGAGALSEVTTAKGAVAGFTVLGAGMVSAFIGSNIYNNSSEESTYKKYHGEK